MYTYTCEMVKTNHYPVLFSTDDLYHSNLADEILSSKPITSNNGWIVD